MTHPPNSTSLVTDDATPTMQCNTQDAMQTSDMEGQPLFLDQDAKWNEDLLDPKHTKTPKHVFWVNFFYPENFLTRS